MTFFINRIINHPIGCVAMTPLPTYIKKNKAVIGLDREPINDQRCNDNLCLFRCLALHQCGDVRRLESAVEKLYETYDDVPMEEFAGVTLDDLYPVETTFQTNVCVYKLVESDDDDDRKMTTELIWRSLCHYSDTMYLNLHETHFSYIQNIQMYYHYYRCRKCEHSVYKDVWQLKRHERTCTGGVRRVYPGGVYHSTPSVFERLDDENIRVPESLGFYPYRATFDIECWFDTARLPSDSDKMQWVARHIPLSVSVASNVPGYEQVQCLVTDGDTNKLMSAMMDILQKMSDAAYENIKNSYEDVLARLVKARSNWDETLRNAQSPDDEESRQSSNPYKTLMKQLDDWLHKLPVIGFNSGKYDLNAVKQFLVPYFLSKKEEEEDKMEQDDKGKEEEEEENDGVGSFFVFKRDNTFMCLSTDKLKFLDMTNYIAPGFSYDKYLKAYGCKITKDNGMTTLRDFLVWYKNRDVVPFLQAIDRQYQQRGIYMFKQGISVPGLTLLYLFNDLPEKTYFTLFNEKNKDLHHLVKDHVVGGPSLVFHRYHEKRVTTLRQNEYGEAARPCRSIVGYDANVLYLWSLMQDMPTGWYTRRREENNLRPETAQLHCHMAVE